MKIALVSPYDFAYPGGVANHITNLERNFTKSGHEVKVIAPASGPVTIFDDRFIAIGKPRPIPASGSIARVIISPSIAPTVKDMLEKEKFDIIHLHEPLIPMMCTNVLRFSKTVNIGTFHATDSKPSYRWSQPFFKMFLKKWFRKLDVKIAVSKSAMEYANKHFRSNYNIIPNGVDIKHFHPDIPPIEEFCDGKINLLFVGRMEKRKGVNYLLEAYQRIKHLIPDSRLLIVGPSGALCDKYKKIVQGNGIRDVSFIGHVSYDELPRYYKTADIFCAPATGYESFGIILLEAMAVGTSIVASNINGYAGVITHNNEGLTVPPKNDKELAKAITTLVRNKRLRQQMGSQGRMTAEKYSWEHITDNLLDCYERALYNYSKNNR